MYNTKIRKIFTGCALAMTLTMTIGSINVFAAATNTEVNTVAPDNADKADDPTSRTGIDPTATDNPATTDADESYTDTDIDVWGYTKDATIYSVDVEWGAMTFEYESSSWDPSTHKKAAGAGWRVYNSATNEAVGTDDTTQDAINRVTVINHSNAEVYAALSYASEADMGTAGKFAGTKTASEDVKATWNSTDATNHSTGYLTLDTAATDATGGTVAAGAAGEPSKGNVYFAPTGITANKTIDKWTKIGKITVALQTEDPAAP